MLVHAGFICHLRTKDSGMSVCAPTPVPAAAGGAAEALWGRKLRAMTPPLRAARGGRVHGCKSPPGSLRLSPRPVVASKALPEPDAPPAVPWHWWSSPPIPPDKGFGSEHPGMGLILSPCRDHPDFLFILVQNSPPLYF